jgi:hypothetical protein
MQAQAQAQRRWFALLPTGQWVPARNHQKIAADIRKNDGDSAGDEREVSVPYDTGTGLPQADFVATFKKVVTIPGTQVLVTAYVTAYGATQKMAYGTIGEIQAALTANPGIWQQVGGMRRRRKSKSKSRKMSKLRRGRKVHKTKRANIKRRKSYRNRK